MAQEGEYLMWRFTSRITIAVLTFIIGITITMVWFIYHPAIDKSVVKYVSLDPSLPLCYLIQNSSEYDSKIVQVRAVLIGYHEIALYDPSCKSEENYIRADFDSTSRQKLIDTISTLNGAGFINGNFEASIVLTGRFEKLQDNDDRNKIKEIERISPQSVKYHYRLVVFDIKHLEAIPDNLSRQ